MAVIWFKSSGVFKPLANSAVYIEISFTFYTKLSSNKKSPSNDELFTVIK